MIYQYYPQVPHPYRFELNKDLHFSAAHYIPQEAAGKCQYMHGHTYTVNVTVGGNTLDELGFLIDFKQLKDLIHKKYDHTVLNDHPEFKDVYPTTEQVAEHLWKTIQKELDSRANRPVCLQVIVRETPTSYVVYRPELEDLS